MSDSVHKVGGAGAAGDVHASLAKQALENFQAAPPEGLAAGQSEVNELRDKQSGVAIMTVGSRGDDKKAGADLLYGASGLVHTAAMHLKDPSLLGEAVQLNHPAKPQHMAQMQKNLEE